MQYCSICNREVRFNPRYKNYVCNDCLEESPPVDDQGRYMEFFDDIREGIICKINDERIPRETFYICYVKGVRCVAEEARFGGVVIHRKKLE